MPARSTRRWVHRGTHRGRDRGADRNRRGRVGQRADDSTIGLYKTECITPGARGRNWAGLRELERGTAEGARWYNQERIHSSIDYMTRLNAKSGMLTPSTNGARWPEPQPLANPGRFTSAPGPTGPKPTARSHGSTAPCSTRATRTDTAAKPTGEPPCRHGCTPTTITTTAPRSAAHPLPASPTCPGRTARRRWQRARRLSVPT
jgi:hypothetical protein